MQMEQQIGDVIIRCEKVTKTFFSKDQNVEVIKNIDLSVRCNEFVVMFGPGQCGKTTILNIIAGLEPATSGSIIVDNKPVEKPRPDIGVVYQDILLFPWLSVMDNVSYGPKIKRMEKSQRKEKAQYYINLVGLQGFEKAYPVKLSGGMQQRVGIARAYCNNPIVLLMDEPFGHLDTQTRYLMQEELQKIWVKDKRTIIFVTNNIEEAIYLADRVVLLDECPTRVKKEFVIDIPRPRNLVDPVFLNYRQKITNAINE